MPSQHFLHVRFHLDSAADHRAPGPTADHRAPDPAADPGARSGPGPDGDRRGGRVRPTGAGGSPGAPTLRPVGTERGPDTTSPYHHLLVLLTDITPRVQALPPDSADLDVTGALRFWGRDTHGIAQLIRLRALALHGVPTTVGAGPSRMIAAMAASATEPGGLTDLDTAPEEITAFLRAQPTRALHGVGHRTAATLSRYGLYTVGAVADTPLLTLQRILGAAAGRDLHERAHGHDPRPVIPGTPDPSATAEHRFPRDELHAAEHRRALLALAGKLGSLLRDSGQVATALTLTVRYADHTSTVRGRALPEATAHSPALARAAYLLYHRLGLQRARVIGVALRAERLVPAGRATRQLLLDPADDAAYRVEAAADRARARFGEGAVRPAALADRRGAHPRWRAA